MPYSSTDEQVVDIFTKGLQKANFDDLKCKLGLSGLCSRKASSAIVLIGLFLGLIGLPLVILGWKPLGGTRLRQR